MNDFPPKRSRSCFFGAFIGVVFTIGFGLLVLVAVGVLGKSIFGALGGGGPKIAHIDLEGVITGISDFGFGGSGKSMVDEIKEELKEAVDNEQVKAIVLRVNSPGGEVTASDTIYEAVRQANEKKPVVVYMDSVAASGGYYVACGATEIMANETTMTGSIGVIISSLKYRELFGKLGLDFQVYKSGEFKDLLAGNRETSPEEAALIQEMVMETYGKFVGIVSKAREIPEEKLRDDIADGRIFTGTKAKEVGLVDATGYIEDAYKRARELGKAPDAEVMKIHRAPSLLEALTMAQGPGGAENRIEIDVSERLLPRLQPGLIYLLPSTWAQ